MKEATSGKGANATKDQTEPKVYFFQCIYSAIIHPFSAWIFDSRKQKYCVHGDYENVDKSVETGIERERDKGRIEAPNILNT